MKALVENSEAMVVDVNSRPTLAVDAKHRLKPQLHPRLTIVGTIYYQPPDGQPVSVELRQGKELSTDEQPYVRRLKIGDAWKPLDCGWVEKASLLVIINERERWSVHPTEAQKAEAEARVVELAIGEQVLVIIKPGEACVFSPTDPKAIKLHCTEGETTVTINLFPV